MAPPPLRVAVCGLGMVAQAVYLPLLLRHPHTFTVTTLCDGSPDRLRQWGARLGIPAARQLPTVADVAVAGTADVALLLTSGSHGAASRTLLDAGLAVLCEKPLAFTRAEADALVGEPRLLLGYMKHFDPAVEAAADALADVGELRSVEVTVLHPSAARQLHHLGGLPPPAPLPGDLMARLEEGDAALRRQALGEAAAREIGRLYTDVLLGSLVHDLALVRSLVGIPTRIDAAERWTGKGGTSVAVSGRLPDDVRLDLRWHLLPDYPSYREQLRLHGEAGSVELTFPSPYLLHHPTTVEVRLADGDGERVTRRTSHAEAFDSQLRSFADVARDGLAPRSTAADGRDDIVSCQRIAAAVAASEDIPIAGEAAQP